MRTMSAWMLAAGMAVLLLSGCEDQNKQAAAVDTAPPQEPAPAPYPGDAGATHASAAPTYTQTPTPTYTQSAVMATPPEPASPPEPVDTEVQAAPRNDTSRSTARQSPKESYARPSKTSTRTYTVKKGDTLQEISQKFYGTTKNWRRIHTANRKAIGPNADKLKVGTKLVIP